VGGIISFWWAASFRYGGRDHLVLVGGLDRNQHMKVFQNFARRASLALFDPESARARNRDREVAALKSKDRSSES
jgi:hypothetical protein